MNYYTTMTAMETIRCTREEATMVMRLLYVDPDEDVMTIESPDMRASHSLSGWEAYYSHSEAVLYFSAEEMGDIDEVPGTFLEAVGQLLKAKDIPFLELGVCFHADKLCPGSHGGTNYRIYPDGSLVSPELVWPE